MKTKDLIKNIRKSYKGTIIQKDHCACKIPQNTEVKKIINLAKQLIFPGYFSTKNIKEKSNQFNTSILVV